MSDHDWPELKPPTPEQQAQAEDAAEVMRRAADLLRSLRTDLGYLGVEWCSMASVKAVSTIQGYSVANAPHRQVVDWIATLGPQIGEPLEAWLRSEAQKATEVGQDHLALAVAYVILRGSDV